MVGTQWTFFFFFNDGVCCSNRRKYERGNKSDGRREKKTERSYDG